MYLCNKWKNCFFGGWALAILCTLWESYLVFYLRHSICIKIFSCVQRSHPLRPGFGRIYQSITCNLETIGRYQGNYLVALLKFSWDEEIDCVRKSLSNGKANWTGISLLTIIDWLNTKSKQANNKKSKQKQKPNLTTKTNKQTSKITLYLLQTTRKETKASRGHGFI